MTRVSLDDTRGAGIGAVFWRVKMIDRSVFLWIVLIGVLILLVANPIFRLFLTSFKDVNDGSWTITNYTIAFGEWFYLKAILNSLRYALFVSIFGTIVGLPIAWAVTRTDVPFKGAIRLVVLGSFIMPSYLATVSWIMLLGPNAGTINEAYKWLTGAQSGIFNIYSMSGLVFVTGLHSFAYMFIFASSALNLVNSEMEDAANILGASRWQATLKITLPLALPAISGGFIVIFLETLALFGVPAMLAAPARINVMTTQLYQFFQLPVRVETAAAYAIPLLLVTVIMFALQRQLLARKGYASLTGKGGDRRLIVLGRWRWPVLSYIGLVALVSVILPASVLIKAAMSKAWGLAISAENFTLENFHFVLFDHELTRKSIENSVTYAAAAAVIAMIISLCIAYIVNRRLVPFGNVLAFMATAPFVIPGIVLAIGFFAAYAGPPWFLYGTPLILIFAFAARYMPISYTTNDAAIKNIHPELEDAVRILGGSRLTAIRHVVAPLLRGSLVGALILVFIPAMRELSAAIFLYSANTPVMSVQLYIFTDEGFFGPLAALGCIMMLITTVLVGLGFRLVGRDFMMRDGY